MNKVFYILISLIMISSCSNPTESRIDRSKKNFEQVMNEASNLCLEKGYKGHEPEYRGCVIQTAAKIFNIKNRPYE